MSSASLPDDLARPPRTQQLDIAAEIVHYWWLNRWRIARILAAALVAFAIVLLLIPSRYKAQATVILLPPRFLPEVRTQPLTVSTVRSLLQSGELLQHVITRLRDARKVLEGKLGANPEQSALLKLADSETTEVAAQLEINDTDLALYISDLTPDELRAILDFKPTDLDEMTVDDLSKLLDSEETVEKKTASDLTFSPLVQLYAIGDSGPKSQVLANTWATLFERMYDQLTRKKTSQQYESIRKQQEQSQKQLESIQTAIVEFKTTNNLELLQRQINENSTELDNFNQQLTVKQASLERLRGRLARLRAIVQASEINGAWVGRVRTYTAGNDTTSEMVLRLPEENSTQSESLVVLSDEISTDSIGQLYDRIRMESLRSGARLTSAIEEANEFNQQRPIQLMDRDLDQLQKDYLEASSRQRIGSLRLESLRQAISKLDQDLSSTQQFITLSTALPDEAIGTAIGAGRKPDLSALAQIQFQRQEINPVWQQLQTQRAILKQEFQTLQGELTQLNERLPQMDSKLKKLQTALFQARQSDVTIKENLDRWQKNNEQLFRNYVELTNDISNTAQEVALLSEEVTALSEATSTSQQRVQKYQQSYDKGRADLEVLELRQRAIQRNADLLLQKVQEAQIAVQEDVSDVSVAARAVAPEKHYFPQRTVFLLIAFLLTTGLLLALLARQRYMELQEA